MEPNDKCERYKSRWCLVVGERNDDAAHPARASSSKSFIGSSASSTSCRIDGMKLVMWLC